MARCCSNNSSNNNWAIPTVTVILCATAAAGLTRAAVSCDLVTVRTNDATDVLVILETSLQHSQRSAGLSVTRTDSCGNYYYYDLSKEGMLQASRSLLGVAGCAALVACVCATTATTTQQQQRRHFWFQCTAVAAACASMAQLPILLLLETSPCTDYTNHQHCRPGRGAYVLIAATVAWLLVVLVTQVMTTTVDERMLWRRRRKVPEEEHDQSRLLDTSISDGVSWSRRRYQVLQPPATAAAASSHEQSPHQSTPPRQTTTTTTTTTTTPKSRGCIARTRSQDSGQSTPPQGDGVYLDIEEQKHFRQLDPFDGRDPMTCYGSAVVEQLYLNLATHRQEQAQFIPPLVQERALSHEDRMGPIFEPRICYGEQGDNNNNNNNNNNTMKAFNHHHDLTSVSSESLGSLVTREYGDESLLDQTLSKTSSDNDDDDDDEAPLLQAPSRALQMESIQQQQQQSQRPKQRPRTTQPLPPEPTQQQHQQQPVVTADTTPPATKKTRAPELPQKNFLSKLRGRRPIQRIPRYYTKMTDPFPDTPPLEVVTIAYEDDADFILQDDEGSAPDPPASVFRSVRTSKSWESAGSMSGKSSVMDLTIEEETVEEILQEMDSDDDDADDKPEMKRGIGRFDPYTFQFVRRTKSSPNLGAFSLRKGYHRLAKLPPSSRSTPSRQRKAALDVSSADGMNAKRPVVETWRRQPGARHRSPSPLRDDPPAQSEVSLQSTRSASSPLSTRSAPRERLPVFLEERNARAGIHNPVLENDNSSSSAKLSLDSRSKRARAARLRRLARQSVPRKAAVPNNSQSAPRESTPPQKKAPEIPERIVSVSPLSTPFVGTPPPPPSSPPPSKATIAHFRPVSTPRSSTPASTPASTPGTTPVPARPPRSPVVRTTPPRSPVRATPTLSPLLLSARRQQSRRQPLLSLENQDDSADDTAELLAWLDLDLAEVQRPDGAEYGPEEASL